MSFYLELLKEKNRLGLISNQSLKNSEKWYNNKGVKQKFKDYKDFESEKELTILKEDKANYLILELISETKKTQQSINNIKGWVSFMGILVIIAIIISLIPYL